MQKVLQNLIVASITRIRLRQSISAKDAVIKELRASKKPIAQELETTQLAVKVAEETSATLRAQRDRAMDKAIRAGQILMRRSGVIVPDDIRADVNAAPDSSPSSIDKLTFTFSITGLLSLRISSWHDDTITANNIKTKYFFKIGRAHV